MHKIGKTIRELSSEYKISPHTISYWKNQKKREMKVKYDEIQSLKVELSEKDRQIKDQAEEIEILKKVYAILMKK